jgi:hypothetical protein
MIVNINMPFRYSIFLKEKEVPFLFRIAALEIISKDILKIEFWELFERKDFDQLDEVLIYGAYLAACQSLYIKPKYNRDHARYWAEYMSKTSKEKFTRCLIELLGEMSPDKEVKELKKK